MSREDTINEALHYYGYDEQINTLTESLSRWFDMMLPRYIARFEVSVSPDVTMLDFIVPFTRGSLLGLSMVIKVECYADAIPNPIHSGVYIELSELSRAERINHFKWQAVWGIQRELAMQWFPETLK